MKNTTIKNSYAISGLENETFFQGLSEHAENVINYIIDLDNKLTAWPGIAVKQFGLPVDHPEEVLDYWYNCLHPDDRKGYINDIQSVFRGEKEKHHYQYRVREANGDYIWVECEGNVQEDPRSHKKFYIGTIIRLDNTGIYDPVTGCLNFKEFFVTNTNEVKALLLVGIDSFRRINSHIGIIESNKVLKILGKTLKDNNPGLEVYRMTGDEFLVALPAYSTEELEYLHEKVSNEFKGRIEGFRKGLKVKFSAGITYYNPATDSKTDVIKRLERTLEYAKKQGPGSFMMYSMAIEEQQIRAAKITESLVKSVHNNCEGFKLLYQPIVRNDNGTIDGAEALLRYYDAELGTISPAEFIPILEENEDIIAVGLWVAEQAIMQKSKWEKIHPGIKIGFNASLIQFRDETLGNRVSELVEKHNISPQDIIVELTESQKMYDAEHLKNMLKPLTDHGIWVFLDDFGMEGSAFTLVQELPVNGIKVDHSFVRTMLQSGCDRKDAANIAIVASINYLAKQLGLRVIVEGVENKEIDQLLNKMNIHFSQGFYYARPITVEELEEKWL